MYAKQQLDPKLAAVWEAHSELVGLVPAIEHTNLDLVYDMIWQNHIWLWLGLAVFFGFLPIVAVLCWGRTVWCGHRHGDSVCLRLSGHVPVQCHR
eukprot:COSAG02_NODE_26422_length_633_cov_1.260300_1_plen_95_part_00